MTVKALSSDISIETPENLFGDMEIALIALEHLRARVLETVKDIPLVEDVGCVLGLYINHTRQLIAKGNELARKCNQAS